MIIFINGSINSGKSTVAKILAEKLGQVALVEIDQLRDFIAWMPISEAVPINLENAAAVIKNFIGRKINVIATYPLSEKNYNYLMENLKDFQDEIKIFTLSPRLEAALKNRGTRELTDQEVERIKYHYKIGIPNPSFGEIIDNSNEMPEETADKILQVINNLK